MASRPVFAWVGTFAANVWIQLGGIATGVFATLPAGETLDDRGLVREGARWEDCYAKFWIALPVFGRNVLFFPTLGKWGAVPLHDVNHILSGCDTSWRGELEIAAWELASGGCGWHLLYWIDRISFVAFGLVVASRPTLRGVPTREGPAQRLPAPQMARARDGVR